MISWSHERTQGRRTPPASLRSLGTFLGSEAEDFALLPADLGRERRLPSRLGASWITPESRANRKLTHYAEVGGLDRWEGRMSDC
jgi:hypothetical protein